LAFDCPASFPGIIPNTNYSEQMGMEAQPTNRRPIRFESSLINLISATPPLLALLLFLIPGWNFESQRTLEGQVFTSRSSPSNERANKRANGRYTVEKPRSTQPGPYQVATEHFYVFAPDPVLANKVAQEAERFRKELAIEWLGSELPPWQDKCPIVVELGMHAGGETSFEFIFEDDFRGVPRNWDMKIFGPPDRIVDSVLPHEITHTIFATHFGRPLPRWADEGACTTVEHESERAKNHQMLMQFLQTNRGIPFNRMFEMKQYPHDILPLYAQGYSLSKFLISQKGKREFLEFIGSGMLAEQQVPVIQAWDRTIENYYGYRDLSELQIAWINWVRSGSQEIPASSLASSRGSRQAEQLPSAPERLASNNPAMMSLGEPQTRASSLNDSVQQASQSASVLSGPISQVSYENQPDSVSGPDLEPNAGGWYARQSRGERVLLNRTDSLQLKGLEKDQEPEYPNSKSGNQVRSLLELDDLKAAVNLSQEASEDKISGPTIWR
jgi:hypothetical protein